MADLVNEIISPEAQKQLDSVSAQLDHLTDQVAELAQAGKAIQFDFKGAKDFAFADEVIKRATASAENFDRVQKELQRTTLDAAKALEAESRAALNNARAATEAAKQKEIEIRYTAALTREKEKLEKQMAKESANAAKLSNDYELLKKAYTEAANRAKNLGVTVGITSDAFKEAAAEAMRMHEVLLRVEQAVGQSQRNVGNYANSLMSVSQILREAPAFANSFNTGLMAISNNLPILMDEFRRLRAEMGALKAFSMLAGSIFTVSNLLVLAFTGLMFFSQALSRSKKEANEYADALKSIEKNARDATAQDEAHAKVLLDTARNTKLAMNIRLAAVKELQELYPNYLGNLSKETIMTGDLTTQVKALNEALLARALLNAGEKKIEEEYKKILDAEKAILGIDKQRAAWVQKQIQLDPRAKIGEASFKMFVAQQQPFRDIITQAKKDIADLSDVTQKYREDSAGLFIPEKDKKEKKGPKDHEFKGAQELAKAQYELDRQRVQQSAATNKALSEDTQLGIQDRLDAYMQYQSDLLELAAMERDKEIAVQDAKIEELNRLEKTAEGKKLQDLQMLEKAAQLRKDAAIEKFNKESQGVTEDGRKDILGIIRTSNEQWIKDQNAAFNDIKAMEMTHYLVEQNLLNDALEKKQITRKVYDKAIAELQNKQHISFLQAEIENDKRLLENDKLFSDQREKIKDDIAKKEQQLADARNKGTGLANPNKRAGRITDPIAKGLLPTDAFKDDAAGMEAYLNEFYNGAINLANQAADAIIQAQNRQFDNMLKHLDDEKAAIATNAQLKEDAITAELGSTTQAQNEIAKLHAQTAIQQDQIEEKKRRIEAERARFERAAAIASIIQSTAIAIAGALKYGLGAPAIIALIAASGAAQLAAVAGSPIPAYKEGTTGHRGGLFIAGDGGEPEFIKAPGKAGYWSASKSTLYSEGKGTTVTPLSKLMGMDASRMGAFSTPDSTSAIHSMSKKITDKLDESIEANLWAMRANRTVISKDESLKFELRKARKL